MSKPIDEKLKEALKKGRETKSDKEEGEDGEINFGEGNLLELTFPEEGIDLERFNIKPLDKAPSVSKLELTV